MRTIFESNSPLGHVEIDHNQYRIFFSTILQAEYYESGGVILLSLTKYNILEYKCFGRNIEMEWFKVDLNI